MALVKLGFVPTRSDPCTYVHKSNGHTLFLILYVDDVLLLVGGNSKLMERLKKALMRRFAMKDIGDVSLMLGTHITRNRAEGMLKISQESHVKSILERFGMTDCNPVYTPGTLKYRSFNRRGICRTRRGWSCIELS